MRRSTAYRQAVGAPQAATDSRRQAVRPAALRRVRRAVFVLRRALRAAMQLHILAAFAIHQNDCKRKMPFQT